MSQWKLTPRGEFVAVAVGFGLGLLGLRALAYVIIFLGNWWYS